MLVLPDLRPPLTPPDGICHDSHEHWRSGPDMRVSEVALFWGRNVIGEAGIHGDDQPCIIQMLQTSVAQGPSTED